MASWLRRTPARALRAELGIPAGERIVGWGSGPHSGSVVASSHALYLAHPRERLPWHRIAKAEWTEPVLEVVTAEAPPTVLRIRLDDERDLPFAVRACVTESVVVSERLDLGDGRGAIAAARRQEDGTIAWSVVFDPGLDPGDPALRQRADEALSGLRSTLGI